MKLGIGERLLGSRSGGRARAGAPPSVPSSAIGPKGVRALEGGAEAAPRGRLGGGRDWGSKPGGLSGPPDIAGAKVQ
eukprot:1799427-Alexandrium_andersonii.AAC.1